MVGKMLNIVASVINCITVLGIYASEINSFFCKNSTYDSKILPLHEMCCKNFCEFKNSENTVKPVTLSV